MDDSLLELQKNVKWVCLSYLMCHVPLLNYKTAALYPCSINFN